MEISSQLHVPADYPKEKSYMFPLAKRLARLTASLHAVQNGIISYPSCQELNPNKSSKLQLSHYSDYIIPAP